MCGVGVMVCVGGWWGDVCRQHDWGIGDGEKQRDRCVFVRPILRMTQGIELF